MKPHVQESAFERGNQDLTIASLELEYDEDTDAEWSEEAVLQTVFEAPDLQILWGNGGGDGEADSYDFEEEHGEDSESDNSDILVDK